MKPHALEALLVVLCLMHGAVAQAQQRYAITKVEGPSPETFLAVRALNDKGEIVGNIASSGGGPAGFHWHRGVYRDLAADCGAGFAIRRSYQHRPHEALTDVRFWPESGRFSTGDRAYAS